MKTRSGWLAAVAAAWLLGCSADSGIIVAVSGPAVEELEFQVGLGREDQFVLDQEISGERHPVPGRDLSANPYELLLREDRTDEQAPPATVRVLVLGYRAGELGAFALMEPPQVFLRGELLRRSLVLQAVGSSATAAPSGKGCYAVRSGDKSFLLVAAGDRDCDGHGPEDRDCDDADPTVNPAAQEVCDGQDNNCDGKYAAPTEPCYQQDAGGVCRQGSRACSEGPAGGGLAPGCPVSEASPAASGPRCLVYQGCAGQSSPILCLQSRLPSISYGCTLELVDGKGSCAGSRDLPAPSSSKSCRWELTSAGGWPISAQPVPESCSVKLLAAAGAAKGSGPVSLDYYDQGNQRGALVSLQVEPKLVTSCSDRPLVCVKK